MIFQNSTLENHLIWQKLGEKLKKSLAQFSFKPWLSENSKSGFRVPNQPLAPIDSLRYTLEITFVLKNITGNVASKHEKHHR